MLFFGGKRMMRDDFLWPFYDAFLELSKLMVFTSLSNS